MASAMQRIDQVIDDLNGKIQAARRMKDLLIECPELADSLLGEQVGNGVQAAAPAVRRRRSSTTADGKPRVGMSHFLAIRQAIADSKDGVLSIAEIASITGLSKNAISNIVYRTHEESFEKVPVAGQRANHWKLSASGKNISEEAQTSEEASSSSEQEAEPIAESA